MLFFTVFSPRLVVHLFIIPVLGYFLVYVNTEYIDLATSNIFGNDPRNEIAAKQISKKYPSTVTSLKNAAKVMLIR